MVRKQLRKQFSNSVVCTQLSSRPESRAARQIAHPDPQKKRFVVKIIIIGAGIGGLTAAAALARLGHEIKVLEQTPEPKPVGAGISLQPNAMACLAKLGIDDEIRKAGFSAPIARLTFANGQLIRELDFTNMQQEYGFLPYTIHRADLFDILHRTAVEAGVEVSFDRPFHSFSRDDDTVSVQSRNERFHADALVGADGINSGVRRQLWEDSPRRYSGYVCWRGIVTDQTLVKSVDTMNEIWGKGSRFGYMRCSPDKIYWFATKSTKQQERPENWKHMFDDWQNPISELLAKTHENRIAFNPISDRRPIFPWSKGRVTLLGDAAHPMTPNFGQGGAQAIEDAIVLSEALDADNEPQRAFQAYESHRHPRTKNLVNASRQYGSVAQGGSPLSRLIRNHLLPLIPKAAMDRKLRAQLDVQPHLDAFLPQKGS